MNDKNILFMTQYGNVFNTDGSVKACGREESKKLIKISNEIDPDVIHGDTDTGFMNISEIQKLYAKISKNK